MEPRPIWRRALFVLLLAALVPIIPFALIGELPGERWLLASSTDALRFGASGAGLLAADILLPIPSSVVGALLGGRLGFGPGFAWAFAGLCSGHVIGYALGRLAPARFAGELPDLRVRRRRFAAALSTSFLVLSRPVPVLAEAVTLAAGAMRVPLPRYLVSIAIGNAVYAGALTANGAALLPDGLVGPGMILPLALPVIAYAIYRSLTTAR